MVSGGQYVMMAGQTLTRKWFAANLVTGNIKAWPPDRHIYMYCHYLLIGTNLFTCWPCRLGETLVSEVLDITPVPRFGVGSGPILLDDVSCTGKEPSLLLCNRREWLRHDCTHHEDVNLVCSPEHNGESLPSPYSKICIPTQSRETVKHSTSY